MLLSGYGMPDSDMLREGPVPASTRGNGGGDVRQPPGYNKTSLRCYNLKDSGKSSRSENVSALVRGESALYLIEIRQSHGRWRMNLDFLRRGRSERRECRLKSTWQLGRRERKQHVDVVRRQLGVGGRSPCSWWFPVVPSLVDTTWLSSAATTPTTRLTTGLVSG
jgi:hypothetical protein